MGACARVVSFPSPWWFHFVFLTSYIFVGFVILLLVHVHKYQPLLIGNGFYVSVLSAWEWSTPCSCSSRSMSTMCQRLSHLMHTLCDVWSYMIRRLCKRIVPHFCLCQWLPTRLQNRAAYLKPIRIDRGLRWNIKERSRPPTESNCIILTKLRNKLCTALRSWILKHHN